MNKPVEVGRLHFRFQCQPGCINCCTQSGHVHLTEEDINRISAYMGLERDVFESRYVRRTPEGPRLTVPRGPTPAIF